MRASHRDAATALLPHRAHQARHRCPCPSWSPCGHSSSLEPVERALQRKTRHRGIGNRASRQPESASPIWVEFEGSMTSIIRRSCAAWPAAGAGRYHQPDKKCAWMAIPNKIWSTSPMEMLFSLYFTFPSLFSGGRFGSGSRRLPARACHRSPCRCPAPGKLEVGEIIPALRSERQRRRSAIAAPVSGNVISPISARFQ